MNAAGATNTKLAIEALLTSPEHDTVTMDYQVYIYISTAISTDMSVECRRIYRIGRGRPTWSHLSYEKPSNRANGYVELINKSCKFGKITESTTLHDDNATLKPFEFVNLSST